LQGSELLQGQGRM